MGLEGAFRAGIAWLPNLWWVAPLSLLINFAVYQLLRTEGGWLYSIVLFGTVTATARILLAFLVLHEPVTVGAGISAAVLLFGTGARLFWR